MTIGCGFGLGPGKFKALAERNGVDLQALNVTPEQAVKHWRAAHPKIVNLWHGHMDAARRASEERVPVGRGIDVLCVADMLVFEMPSQRWLCYHDFEQDPMTYRHRGVVKRMYGSKLTQNIVQAIARDVLAEALVTLEAAGLPVVLHVHDEIVVEVDSPDAAVEVERLMRQPPRWAPELRLKTKARTSRRWR